MSIYYFIYKATIKKLSNLKNIYNYTNHYQVAFGKIVNLITKTFFYIQKNLKIYF